MRVVASRPLSFARTRVQQEAPVGGYTPLVIAAGIPVLLILGVAGLTSFASVHAAVFVAITGLAATLAAVTQAAALAHIREDARARVARARRYADDLADSRVDAIARQFAWAVEDNARLGRELRKANLERSTALAGGLATHREILELRALLDNARARLAEVSPSLAADLEFAAGRGTSKDMQLYWGLHDDGRMRWLQLESGAFDAVPRRVRVRDANGEVLAMTSRSLWSRTEGARSTASPRRGLGSLVFRVPDRVIDALVKGDRDAYRFEALVEDEWWTAHLVDTGIRASSRQTRAARKRAAAQPAVAAVPLVVALAAEPYIGTIAAAEAAD